MPSNPFNRYQDIQTFRKPWLAAILIVSTLTPVTIATIQLVQDGGSWFNFLVMVTLVALPLGFFFFFMKLKVSIGEGGLEYSFLPFIRTRTIPWSQLQHVRLRNYDALGEFWGWGIKKGAGGWSYTMSGDLGLDLTFADGHHILLGVQDRETWQNALTQYAPAGIWDAYSPKYNHVSVY